MQEDIKYEKSKKFSIRIVRMYQHLVKDEKEFVLSKQVLRAGTSIGANLAEAQCAMSTRDFLAKLYIAYKESSETQYWLELLHETDYLSDAEFESINADCSEILRILAATTKTLHNKVIK
ncbi:MAG: four helix bundle protein [Spirochaetaceae bacterium]|jgi:four helix bundle protein|nr:four helix bundle protein [Spirochaetaceae bacterium]